MSDLLFANTTLVFCEAMQIQMIHLSWLFMWFKDISRLKIILEKSELILI